MPQRPRLFVGIPSRSGRISTELHRYLTGLQVCSALGTLPFEVLEAIVTGLTPVQYARNVLLRLACEEKPKTEHDRVFLIDDDMLPDATTTRVLRSAADICVPRMFRFRHHGADGLDDRADRPPEIACCATVIDGEERFDLVPELDADGAMKVDAAGTGCIAIRRRLLDDPRMLCGEPDADGTPAFFRLVQSATGRISEWEDVDFTLRATRLGYSVVVDWGARCGHRKEVNLDAVAELVYRGNQDERLVGAK